MSHTDAHRRFKSLAALALAALAATGCATKPVGEPSYTMAGAVAGATAYGQFRQTEIAELNTPTPVSNLYFVGGQVFAYSTDNVVYRLSKSLDLIDTRRVAREDDKLFAPILFGDKIIYPTSLAYLVYDSVGRLERTVTLPFPLTTNVSVDQRGLLLAGVASHTGGRVNMVDPTRDYRVVRQETLVGSLRSTPAGWQGVVFAANENGQVFAIGPDNVAVWPLSRGFDANRPVTANLVVDDFGVYVASTDTKLYALDRNTGQIRWRYFAQEPLTETPMVSADRVYQVVPNKGLVAIDKLQPANFPYREPIWTVPGVTKVLSSDGRLIYAATADEKLVAIDIVSGSVRFAGDVSGYKLFAATADGRAIFAAKPDGTIAVYRPEPTGSALASR